MVTVSEPTLVSSLSLKGDWFRSTRIRFNRVDECVVEQFLQCELGEDEFVVFGFYALCFQ